MKNSLIFSTLWTPLHENVVLVTPSLYISLSTGTYRAYEQNHSHQLKHCSCYKKDTKKKIGKKEWKRPTYPKIKLRLTLISLREWNGLKPQCHFLATMKSNARFSPTRLNTGKGQQISQVWPHIRTFYVIYVNNATPDQEINFILILL